MAMHGLFLEAERCPDGVELVAQDERGQKIADGARPFRYRTERRELFRLELENLEHPVVLDFVNAFDPSRVDFGPSTLVKPDKNRPAAFLSKYGFPAGNRHVAGSIYELARLFWHWLHEAGAFVPGEDDLTQHNRGAALKAINDAVSSVGHTLNLLPLFDLKSDSGAPRMLLKCPNLDTFMVMEVAMVAMNGVRWSLCDHCEDIILTGPLTGHRSHAKYCSSRCRVAAMRARNAQSANTKQGD
jgi:hypothetical protein